VLGETLLFLDYDLVAAVGEGIGEDIAQKDIKQWHHKRCHCFFIKFSFNK